MRHFWLAPFKKFLLMPLSIGREQKLQLVRRQRLALKAGLGSCFRGFDAQLGHVP